MADRIRGGVTAALCATIAGGVALATVPQQGVEKPFLTFYSGGADTFLRSDKDRWLLDSLRRIERAGVELPPQLAREFHSDPAHAMVVGLVRDLLTTRIAGSLALKAPEQGGPPMPDGQVLFLGNDRRPGASIHADLIKALEMSGASGMFRPDPAHRGMIASQAEAGQPRVWIGSLDVAGRSAAAIGVGRPPQSTPPSFTAFGLKAGEEPQFALELDFAPLQPFLEMASVMLPQGPDGKTPLEQFGFVSPTPMTIRVVGTNDGSEGRIHARLVNGVKAMKIDGLTPSSTLTAADLQWIPADASIAMIGRQDLAAALNSMIDQYNAQMEAFGVFDDFDFDDENDDADGMNGMVGGAAGGEGEGLIDQWFAENLGLNLRRDLIAPLGDLVVLQSSRSLGGGLLGGAYVITLADAQAMKRSLRRLASMLDELEDARSIGFAMRRRSHPGCDDLYSLSFAGLPVPLQFVVGIGNGALVMGLSPQAVVHAIAQATASTSIRDHAGFRRMGALESLKNASGLMWLDTPSLLPGGYPLVLGAATALDSLTLPQSGAATPLHVMPPTLTELQNDAKPSLLVSAYDGDDIVVSYRCDGSFTVQLAAIGSLVGGFGSGYAAIAAGSLMPAMAHSRGLAGELRSAVDLREIGMAIFIYGAEHEGQFPETLDALVANGYLNGPVRNERMASGLSGAFVYRPAAKERGNDPEAPVAWEGYHAWPQGGVMVLFADGQVRTVASEEAFRRMIGQ